jgi:hypothetical protein
MDDDPLYIKTRQPTVFNLTETSHSILEFSPALWSAAEELTAPEIDIRQAALGRLAAMNAPRLSPLIAYLVASRILEPDLALRKRVVQTLSEILAPDKDGQPAPESVIRHLSAYLAQMRTRSIVALLQVAALDPRLADPVARLFNVCPDGGSQLAEILSDRKNPLEIRRQAAQMIGLVGYLDALPVLDRLETRLCARLDGQQSIPFALSSGPDETELLPIVQNTIKMLRNS